MKPAILVKAQFILKKLSMLGTALTATLRNDILERFEETIVVLQRPGLDLSTAVELLNSVDGL